MKFQIYKTRWKAGGGIFASLLLLMSFQNCGKAGFDSSLDDGLAMASTDPNLTSQFGQTDAAKVQLAPFAFDVLSDQISYNSCTGPDLMSNTGFFTVRIGAHATGGVRVRQTFLDYLKTNFQPVYPATTFTPAQIKNYMAYSPENAGAQPQFALRARGAPQVLRVPANSTPALGIDYVNTLDALTNDRYMAPLALSGTAPVFYFPFGIDPTSRNVFASFSYNDSETTAQNLRNDFVNKSQISQTFTSASGDPFAARAPIPAVGVTPSTTIAYGRGYNLMFSVDIAPLTKTIAGANARVAASNPNSILTGVNEVNLEVPASSSGGTWNCDANRRYAVVRLADAALCPPDGINLLSDQVYRTELEIVRRHLRPEDWDVSISRRCVVPKRGSCYPTEVLNGSTVQIQYDQTQECFQGIPGQNLSNPAAPPTKRCAHYVSICTRN